MDRLFSTDVLLSVLGVGVVALVAFGVGAAARRAGFARPRNLAAGVAVGLVSWLVATAALALAGVFEVSADGPARAPLLLLLALVTFVALSLTPAFRRLLTATPAWQPVALQAFRFGVELALWRLYRDGLAPVQITFEGRNFDALVGLSAPLIAAEIAAGWVGPRGVVVWNLFGLAALSNAIWTVATSAPGPQHLDWPGEPFAALAAWPVVWIPALLAPAGIFLHVVSLRQAVRLVTDRRATRFTPAQGSQA